jgi:hypothetical protein
MARTSIHALFCIAGMTLNLPILAVLRIPQTTFSTSMCPAKILFHDFLSGTPITPFERIDLIFARYLNVLDVHRTV